MKEISKNKLKSIVCDGFYPNLIQKAELTRKYEIPFIPKVLSDFKNLGNVRNLRNLENFKSIQLISFTKRRTVFNKKDYYIHFYEHDKYFESFIADPVSYLKEIKQYGGIISPDCSLYRDMPLYLQLTNTGLARSVGAFYASEHIPVIPNVRWSDRRSFDFCFDGLWTDDIYAIGTHGCIQGRENKHYFKQGLSEMIKRLRPRTVIVYGRMPASIFAEYAEETLFIPIESELSRRCRQAPKQLSDTHKSKIHKQPTQAYQLRLPL